MFHMQVCVVDALFPKSTSHQFYNFVCVSIYLFLTLFFLNKELQFCKEYDVKSGYKYTTFFHIESLKPSKNVTDNEDTVVDLRLFVLASKDAHILLSPTDQIKSSPIYEIGEYLLVFLFPSLSLSQLLCVTFYFCYFKCLELAEIRSMR